MVVHSIHRRMKPARWLTLILAVLLYAGCVPEPAKRPVSDLDVLGRWRFRGDFEIEFTPDHRFTQTVTAPDGATRTQRGTWELDHASLELRDVLLNDFASSSRLSEWNPSNAQWLFTDETGSLELYGGKKSDPDEHWPLEKLGAQPPGKSGPPAGERNASPRSRGSDSLDGYSPLFYAILFLLELAVGFAVVVIGVVVCLGGVAAGVTLMMLGVTSSSVFAGLLARRASAGFRAMLAQLCVLFAIPCAVGAFWLVTHFGHLAFRIRWVILSGVGCGLVSGLALAFVLDLLLGIVLRRLPMRFRLAASQAQIREPMAKAAASPFPPSR